MAALASGFDWHIEFDARQPGRHAFGRIEAVLGREANGGIWLPTGSTNSSFGHVALCASDAEPWVKIECRQVQHFKIPLLHRPIADFATKIVLEIGFESRVSQRSCFQVLRLLFSRN